MDEVEKYEMKLYRPPIEPTLGCLVYFGTLLLVAAIVGVGIWGLVLALTR